MDTIEDLFYDPDTGIFTRVVTLGGITGEGYVGIKVNNKTYKAHRLAWELTHGPIPKGYQIDHINGIRSYNRIENLRLGTHKDQSQNRKKRVDNTSGFVGVTYCKQMSKWAARIDTGGIRTHLGFFDTAEEANCTREKAKVYQHTFNPVQR